MAASEPQICPLCQVKIIPCGMLPDRVEFAFGPAGTRDILWQRVCCHVQKAGCINTSPSGKPPS